MKLFALIKLKSTSMLKKIPWNVINGLKHQTIIIIMNLMQFFLLDFLASDFVQQVKKNAMIRTSSFNLWTVAFDAFGWAKTRRCFCTLRRTGRRSRSVALSIVGA